jgi:HEAT repeat protein
MARENWKSEKIFERLVNNKSQKTYWKNISELRKRANEEIYDQAYELAKSEIDKNKIIGIDVLAQLGFDPRIGKQKTVELYFELLENGQNDDVLFSLLFGISHNNENLTEKQILKLIEFKNYKNKDIRYSLVSALSTIENPKAIETLIELSEDKLSSIRNWATFGIGTLSEENNDRIINALWKRTKDKHQETKLEAIVGLANREVIKVKENIIEELKNGEYGTLLFDAIETLKDKDFIPYLENNLKSANKDSGIKEEWISDLKQCLNKLKE